MTKLFVLAAAVVKAVLASAALSSVAAAQAPATNPMPDGSRDMYVGLGVVERPRYEGGAERERRALPVVQFQWSNGVFVSGASAGMHLSRLPHLEFGPLVELQPGRDAGGAGEAPVGIEDSFTVRLAPENPSADLPADLPPGLSPSFPHNRLAGMPEIDPQLQAGGFLNLYLSPQWRLTSTALYGAGNERHGARLDLGVQRVALHLGAHHRVTLAAGITLVNRSHNAAFFGVSEEESVNSGNAMYAPRGGLKDVHLGVRWNWALSPAWMLTSHVQASRLQGDARRSPLVERPGNLALSTALVWRF